MSGRGPNPVLVVDGERECIGCHHWFPVNTFKLLSPSTRKKAKQKRDARCDPCRNASKREWRRRNPDRMKLEHRKTALKKYGITLEGYDRLFSEQGGRCAICKQPEQAMGVHGEIKNLSVDHCHETNVVRGLLCQECNTAIGSMHDDVDRLQAAIDYLVGTPSA